MAKSYIKKMLREFLEVTNEASEKETPSKKDKKSKVEAEYAQISSGFEGLGAPSQADIMQLAGMGKKGDKTAESLFSKKLYRKKNKETGGTYLFNDEERASVAKAKNTAKK